MDSAIEWLLQGEAFVEYRARIDLMGEPEGSPKAERAREGMLVDPRVQALIQELKGWPGAVLSSHKSAGQPFHKLAFIADLGLTRDDRGVGEVSERIFQRQSDEGPFQLPTNIPEHFGGTGRDQWAWSLCDAPVIVYALAKMGYGKDSRVQRAAAHLVGLAKENGWPCTVSKELGSFRGPGRKGDPCPYATLAMLKMLSQFDGLRDCKEAHAGAESLLTLWEESSSRHPYMFYMGTDFRKLKAPFVWYDITHVLEAISHFGWLRNDSRLAGIAGLVRSKADGEGRYTPESEWKAWKEWEFGQKKLPSRWLTLLILRALKRLDVNQSFKHASIAGPTQQ